MKRGIAGVILSSVLLAGCGDSNNNSNPAAPTPTPSPAPAPAATASRIELSASPTLLLLSGSTVTITGRLTDGSGAALGGRTIQLTTGSGTLNVASAVTDQNGMFTATLTGSASTTVRASTSGADGAVDVGAIAPFVVGLDSKYSVIQPGDTVDMLISVTPMPGLANAPGPSTLTLDCGNGQTISLGPQQRTAACTYREKGGFVATLTAATANGWSTTATTRLSSEGKPVNITLTAREVASGPGEIEMEFIAVGAPDRSLCSWDFGEGTKKVDGACNQNFVYAPPDVDDDGNVTITVTVRVPGGDVVTAETTITLDF